MTKTGLSFNNVVYHTSLLNRIAYPCFTSSKDREGLILCNIFVCTYISIQVKIIQRIIECFFNRLMDILLRNHVIHNDYILYKFFFLYSSLTLEVFTVRKRISFLEKNDE